MGILKTDKIHVLFTILEVALILALLVHQDILSLHWPFVNVFELWCRISDGLAGCWCFQTATFFLLSLFGSGALIATGSYIGLLNPKIRHECTDIIWFLCVSLFSPAIVEEVIFRGLLMRLPQCGLELSEDVVNMLKSQASAQVPTPAQVNKPVSLPGSIPKFPHPAAASFLQRGSPVEEGISITCPVTWGLRFEMVLVLAVFVVSRLDVFHKVSVSRNARFLLLTTMLGIFVQESYLQTLSLWPGIVLHWLWAWSWVTFGAPDNLEVS